MVKFMAFALALVALPAAAQEWKTPYDQAPGSSDTFGGSTYGTDHKGHTWETQQFGGTTLYKDSQGNYGYSYSNGGHTEYNRF